MFVFLFFDAGLRDTDAGQIRLVSRVSLSRVIKRKTEKREKSYSLHSKKAEK